MGNSISTCKYIAHEYALDTDLNKEQVDYIVAKYILLMDLDACIKMQTNSQSYRTLMNQTIFKILNKMLDSDKIHQLYERIYGSSKSLLGVDEMYIKTSVYYTNIAYIYSIIYVRLHTVQIPSHKKETSYVNFPEILQFYKNTAYDLKLGGFMELTNESYKQYQEDLRVFYESFTLYKWEDPEKDPPSKFGDIVLLDYCNSSLEKDGVCITEEEKESIGQDRHETFKQYGIQLRLLLNQTNVYKNELNKIYKEMLIIGDKAPTNILNDLFSDDSGVDTCMKLTDEYTAEFVDKILDRMKEIEYQYHIRYITCLQLYEAITENTIYNTITDQLPILEDLYIRLSILE